MLSFKTRFKFLFKIEIKIRVSPFCSNSARVIHSSQELKQTNIKEIFLYTRVRSDACDYYNKGCKPRSSESKPAVTMEIP
ncbi:hypothetical protein evm_009771 [Chilo suppressalis]|nr:hypothetical protein evm_009771 [Chilo suppressalis]